MNSTIAAQLMIGPEELSTFGRSGILDRLAQAEELLDFGALFLAVTDTAPELAARIVDRCHARRAQVALWTMVLADAPGALPPVVDAQGHSGYGRLGVWSGMGAGDEKFLFCCPVQALEDDDGPARAAAATAACGADAVFLDRIRYPSPSSGLELLGACGCPACRGRFRAETGDAWPDLATLAAELSGCGAEGAQRFLALAEPALRFRARNVATVVERYARAARTSGRQVGLDLLAPALGPLVGQDYRLLAPHADFVKAMLYCQARGPAGLPLELSCLVEGLAATGVPRAAAEEFTAALTGLPLAEVRAAGGPEGLPPARAGAELTRAREALRAAGAGEGVLFAGIELVDHPHYQTRIDGALRDGYLRALAGQPVAVCWNVLHVPDTHLRAVREAYDPAGRSGTGVGKERR